MIGRDYRYLYVNDAVARQGRTQKEALLGRTMQERYPGIESTEMFALLRHCMESGTDARMETEFVFPDGSIGWFDLHFEPVPEGVTILSTEITGRKQAELLIRRTVRALTVLSQTNQTLVRAVEEQRYLEDLCKIIVDTAGYPRVWLGLARDGELGTASTRGDGPLPPHLVEFASREYRRARQQETSGEPTILQLLAGGSESPAHAPLWCILLPLRQGSDVLGVLAICSPGPSAFDTEERSLLYEVALDLAYGISTLRARRRQEHTRAALEEAQARLLAIYEHLPHATLVWRKEGDGYALVDCNGAADRMTAGNVRPASTAAEVERMIPGLRADLEDCAVRGRPVSREVECTFPGSRERRRVRLSYGLILPDTVLLHAEDVTEQRQTQEQLAVALRLEAIGRLAGGVAHDFNNLLTVVAGCSDALEAELAPGDPAHDYVEQIHNAVQSGAHLTRQLLAFGRQQVLEPQALDLNDVVSELQTMLRRLLRADIRIDLRLAHDLGQTLVDRGKIEQVIVNLAINARDAMPSGGTLTIETANVQVVELSLGPDVAPGTYIRLTVADTGIGMDATIRGRLFDPFFTTKEPGKGTGLGLATVYGIVKQSGGTIRVMSEPGRGSRFDVVLPRLDTSPGDERAVGR